MAKGNNTEIWKPVPGYPGYEASNKGRIKSLPRIGGRNRIYGGVILKGRAGGHNSPYHTVYLGRRSNARIHQIVLLTFVGPRPKGMICCHNNGNKLDNRLENLRYDTHRGNVLDRSLHNTDNKGQRHGLSKLSDDDARVVLSAMIDLERKMAKRFNVSEGCIRAILAGRRWRHLSR